MRGSAAAHALAVAGAAVLAFGCSAILQETDFELRRKLTATQPFRFEKFQFPYSRSSADAAVFESDGVQLSAYCATDRTSIFTWGPVFVPFIPIPLGQIEYLSDWESIRMRVSAEALTQPVTFGFSSAALRVGREGAWISPIRVSIVYPERELDPQFVILEPCEDCDRTSRWVDVDFGVPPRGVHSFEVRLGTVRVGETEHEWPLMRYTRNLAGFRYEPLLLK